MKQFSSKTQHLDAAGVFYLKLHFPGSLDRCSQCRSSTKPWKGLSFPLEAEPLLERRGFCTAFLQIILFVCMKTALYTIISEDKMGIFKHLLVGPQFPLTFCSGNPQALSNDSCSRPLLHFFQKQMPEKGTIILSLFIFNSQVIGFSAV